MKVNLELLTFIGVVLTLIISIFSIWDRVKPKSKILKCQINDKNLIIENLGQSKVDIIEIKINNHDLSGFTYSYLSFPVELSPYNSIKLGLVLHKHVGNPNVCSIYFTHFKFFKKIKNYPI